MMIRDAIDGKRAHWISILFLSVLCFVTCLVCLVSFTAFVRLGLLLDGQPNANLTDSSTIAGRDDHYQIRIYDVSVNGERIGYIGKEGVMIRSSEKDSAPSKTLEVATTRRAFLFWGTVIAFLFCLVAGVCLLRIFIQGFANDVN